MISNRNYGLIRLHTAFKIIGGLAIFWAVVWALSFFFYQERLDPKNYTLLSVLIPVAALVEMIFRHKDRRSLCGLSRGQISNITQREILFAISTILGLIVMSRNPTVSRSFLGIFVSTYAIWLAWMNHVGHRILQRRLYRKKKSAAANTVVVAPASEIEHSKALHMTANLPGSELLGYIPYGNVSPDGTAALDLPDFPLLGDFANIHQICLKYRARLLLALGLDNDPKLVRMLQGICDSLGMRLIWVENKQDHFAGNLEAYQSGNQVMLMNWQEPLEDPINRMAKRATDVLFSSLVVLTILPGLCLFVWLLHRFFSPGPLFYRQLRTGRDGEVFEMLKFRSMHVNDTPGTQATVGDNRILTGGNFLRRSSLDEIPQFLNVFKGEMSIVGPRPHFVDHDAAFGEIIENYPLRQFAKPGITGLAQVKGCRGETNTPKKVRQRVRLDHFYLHHWSPMLDLFIVCDTVMQVIWPHRNAR